ncbi:transaldolase A [Klebsiella pneumoniae]|uniref:Transaldolase A n=2 Tax=Klebsiella pneumoniae TaxID=573 RepID=A0A2X3H2U4_KLEPN|nr:transaldolase A [Klebsiella pneumoniae]
MSQLDELKKYTTVVADTGDIESIKKFAPQDATTNPSLVLKAAQLPQYQPLIADAIGKARRQGGSAETQLINACDQVAVDIGSEVLRHVPGRISTEVDARFAWDRGMCVAKARKLIQLYEKNGIGPERILIKLAATWEGIRAAEELEQSGINLQPDAAVLFRSGPGVRRSGRLSHLALCGPHLRLVSEAPAAVSLSGGQRSGVVSVRQIYQYYKSQWL